MEGESPPYATPIALTSVLSQNGRGGKWGEDGLPPSREKGRGRDKRRGGLDSGFRRNDEKGRRE